MLKLITELFYETLRPFWRLPMGMVPFLVAVLLCTAHAADGQPVNNARRGGIAEAPENTLATYQRSIDIGVDYLELDIWLSADDVPVCFHDRTVDRTTDGTGLVFEKTLSELKALDAGSWFSPQFAGEQIPTFQEAVQLISGDASVRILLDIKYYEGPVDDRPKYLPLVAQVLSDAGFPIDRTRCWSKGLAQAAECSSFLPNVSILHDAWDANKFDEVRVWQQAAAGDIGLMVRYFTVTPYFVDLVHSYGLTLHVMDINAPSYPGAFAMGVNGFLTTNPRSLADLLPQPDPQCSDGLDNDGDSLLDFPDDTGCFGPADDHEASECSDGLDNDGDGHTDYPDDPGCFAAFYPFEAPACSDGIDNNADGFVDYPADPGCFAPVDQREGLHCSDGLDNDLDGMIDYPEDSGCSGPDDTSEVGAPASAIPDGSTIPGDPLTLGKAAQTDIVAMWDAACNATDDDYALYEGALGNFESHIPVVCSTNGQTIWTFTPAEGNRYYLVVPRTPTSEGSYGVDSSNAQRPASGSSCGEQVLGSCD